MWVRPPPPPSPSASGPAWPPPFHRAGSVAVPACVDFVCEPVRGSWEKANATVSAINDRIEERCRATCQTAPPQFHRNQLVKVPVRPAPSPKVGPSGLCGFWFGEPVRDPRRQHSYSPQRRAEGLVRAPGDDASDSRSTCWTAGARGLLLPVGIGRSQRCRLGGRRCCFALQCEHLVCEPVRNQGARRRGRGEGARHGICPCCGGGGGGA